MRIITRSGLGKCGLWRHVPASLLLVAAIALLAGGLYPGDSQDSGREHSIVLAQDEGPTANAGGNQNVTKGAIVTLDGSGSMGFEGAGNLNFTWNITFSNRTAGTQLTDLYGMNQTIHANQTGVYTIRLNVTDSLNRTGSDTIYIIVTGPPKTFLEKNWLSLIILGVLLLIGGVYLRPAIRNLRAGLPMITEAGQEKIKLTVKKTRKIMKQLVKNRMGILGIIILIAFGVMAVIGPSIAGDVKTQSEDPLTMRQKPSADHWLGTDNYGIDILDELFYGARTSMLVGVVSAIIASFLGAAVGLYSGYVGGWKDEIVMRANDVVLSIPWLVLMIIVAAMLGEITLTGIILIIGLTGWSYTARLVRAQVLSIKERQYIERARSIGASDLNIIGRHIFPNTFPMIFANTILTVAVSILSEATLSFLHLRPVGEVTWGTMLSFASDNSAFENGLHWWILAPGLCIVVVVLGFTLLGYALDDILNPKLRHR
ncbi:MAG: ABC transporter permease subunit [Thermoplasmata archaeon]|nr:ABC transporter permease subunit [Thermoplasmata archaeon]